MNSTFPTDALVIFFPWKSCMEAAIQFLIKFMGRIAGRVLFAHSYKENDGIPFMNANNASHEDNNQSLLIDEFDNDQNILEAKIKPSIIKLPHMIKFTLWTMFNHLLLVRRCCGIF